MSDNTIRGGYYLKARQIEKSTVAHAAPHVREIWDWLIRSAQHKPYTVFNKTINRGQVLTSYEEIANDLHWMVGFIKKVYKKYQIDCSLRWLRQEGMIETMKTTRGLIITICKYDTYQDPSNYDYDMATQMITTRRTATINKNDKNDKKEIDNRGKGDLQSPQAPPQVFAAFTAQDGSIVKTAALEYRKEDFNGLPEVYMMQSINLVKNIKQVDVSPERMKEAWESFKLFEIHKKLYRSKDDVYSFFSNYCKRQSWKKTGEEKATPKKSEKQKKIVGVKFLNDFSQCEMSDGSVVELNRNQSDSAKSNLINPSSIVK